MVNLQDSATQKKVLIGLCSGIVLILLVLLIFGPLRSSQPAALSEPTLELLVIEALSPGAGETGYSILVAAITTGEPEPEVTFNRNDGLGEVEPNTTLIILEEGETYTLTAAAVNKAGQVQESLLLFPGVVAGLSSAGPRSEGDPEIGPLGPGEGEEEDEDENGYRHGEADPAAPLNRAPGFASIRVVVGTSDIELVGEFEEPGE